MLFGGHRNSVPLAITLGKSFEDDCSFFNPDYICNNKNEFESTIKEILASDEILNIIQMLFAKAAMISR